jgi:hypothetical protein
LALRRAQQARAHGVVVSHPLRMRKALGSIPSVSIYARQMARDNPSTIAGQHCDGKRIAHLQVADWAAALVTARLAQPAERKALNLVVVGSSPTVGAFRLHTRSHAQRACTHISAGTHVDVQRHTDTQTHRRTPSHTEPQGRHAHIIQDVTG